MSRVGPEANEAYHRAAATAAADASADADAPPLPAPRERVMRATMEIGDIHLGIWHNGTGSTV